MTAAVPRPRGSWVCRELGRLLADLEVVAGLPVDDPRRQLWQRRADSYRARRLTEGVPC